MKKILCLLAMILIFSGSVFSQTKQDTLNLQEKQYQFQVAINESQRLEAALKEQKAKAFDAWTEYQKALIPFQQPAAPVQKEEKKKKGQ
jgi:hypothetical protein